MKRLTSDGLRRARSRKHRRRLEDLVRAAQRIDLLAQRLDLLTLGRGRQTRAQALIGLHPADVLAQRLRRHAQVARDVRDRPAALDHNPSAAIKQLRRVLAWTGASTDPPRERVALASRSPSKPAWLNRFAARTTVARTG